MTDWRRSPPHIDLLSKFEKPRDVSQVLRWQYLRESIKGSIGDAISQFVSEGFLVHCDLPEVLTELSRYPISKS